MKNFKSIIRQKNIIDKKIEELNESIETLDGYVTCKSKKNGEEVFVYNVENHDAKKTRKRKNLNTNIEEDLSLCKKLVNQKYIKEQINIWNRYSKAYTEFIENIKSIDNTSKNNTMDKRFKKFLKPRIEYINDENSNWNSYKERECDFHPENLKCNGPGGMYRSKTEVSIAMKLKSADLEFKYESRLNIGDKEFFPDFIIKRPNSDKFVILEHLGVMDNHEYFDHAMMKLNTYIKDGYRLNLDLFLTSETKDNPLTAMDVNTVVESIIAGIENFEY